MTDYTIIFDNTMKPHHATILIWISLLGCILSERGSQEERAALVLLALSSITWVILIIFEWGRQE